MSAHEGRPDVETLRRGLEEIERALAKVLGPRRGQPDAPDVLFRLSFRWGARPVEVLLRDALENAATGAWGDLASDLDELVDVLATTHPLAAELAIVRDRAEEAAERTDEDDEDDEGDEGDEGDEDDEDDGDDRAAVVAKVSRSDSSSRSSRARGLAVMAALDGEPPPEGSRVEDRARGSDLTVRFEWNWLVRVRAVLSRLSLAEPERETGFRWPDGSGSRGSDGPKTGE